MTVYARSIGSLVRTMCLLVVLSVVACSDRSPEQQPTPEPRAPSAGLSVLRSRLHEPGDLTLRCVARDPDGDLAAARLTGPSLETRFTWGGSADTVLGDVSDMPAGQYEFICTATDAGGRVGADTLQVTIAASVVPATSDAVSKMPAYAGVSPPSRNPVPSADFRDMKSM